MRTRSDYEPLLCDTIYRENAMTQIILNDDQAELMQRTAGSVEVWNRRGELLGYFSPPPSPTDTAEAKQRLNSDGPWYSTQQVIGHLDSLGAG
jgi:hypothetical protein